MRTSYNPARWALLATFLFAASGSGAAELRLPEKRVLPIEAARRVVVAAAEAMRNGSPCVLAVVDDGGWLVLRERMDGAPMLASVELVPGKARAAAIYRRPTQALEESVNHGRPAALTARSFVQMQGGVPLVVGGPVVGAIGASADTPAHYQQIAEGGARALRG